MQASDWPGGEGLALVYRARPIFSRFPEVGGGAERKAREGLADVISMHEVLM